MVKLTKGPRVDLGRAIVVNVDVQKAFGFEANSDKLRGLRPSEGEEIAKAAELSRAVHEAGGADTVLITGKIAEVCVRAAAESLRDLFPNMRIVLVDDAISSMPADSAKSVGLASREEVVLSLETQGIETIALEHLLPSSSFIADGVRGR